MSGFAQLTALPARIRLFPLGGALLLPGGSLPLNIFEPRYLEMVRDAIADDRMIGMIQPRDEEEPPALYDTGCLGRITEFAETGDGRYLIVLSGLSRFRLREEAQGETPYRQAHVDYTGFERDLAEPPELPGGVRSDIEEALKTYLDAQGLSADWDAVAQADDAGLVRTLAAVCPFNPIEKQALLEADDLPARADMLVALMRFAPAAPEPATTTVQ